VVKNTWYAESAEDSRVEAHEAASHTAFVQMPKTVHLDAIALCGENGELGVRFGIWLSVSDDDLQFPCAVARGKQPLTQLNALGHRCAAASAQTECVCIPTRLRGEWLAQAGTVSVLTNTTREVLIQNGTATGTIIHDEIFANGFE
jgi:hypothetical protein